MSAFPTEAAARAVEAVLEVVGDWCAIVLRDAATAEVRLVGLRHRQSAKSVLMGRLASGWLSRQRILAWREVLEANGPTLLTMDAEEQSGKLFGSRERVALARRIGTGSVLLAPLLHDRRELGFLIVAWADPRAGRSAENVALVRELAGTLAMATAHLKRMELAQQTRAQLALTGLRLRAILESIPQGVIVADAPDGRIVSFNPALESLIGRSINLRAPVSRYPAMMGLYTTTGEPFRSEALPWVRCARDGRSVGPEEMVIRRPHRPDVTVLCTASPVEGEEHRSAGAVAVLQDISERKEIELLKDQFLAVVAHELKTPLTSLKGYSQMLLRWKQRAPDHPLGEREVIALQALDRQVDRLTRLVSGLLDVSRIQMGRLEMYYSKFDVASLVADVVAQMKMVAADRDWEVVVSGDSLVEADRYRIEQVLTNLIGNALKATGEGGRIEVRVERQDGSVVTCVCDNGTGMPPDVQRHVFERLYRGPGQRTQGLGLGLHISKHIIDTHGGRIWFDSEQGKGTVFCFALAAASKLDGE